MIQILYYNPSWPDTYYVAQTGLKLTAYCELTLIGNSASQPSRTTGVSPAQVYKEIFNSKSNLHQYRLKVRESLSETKRWVRCYPHWKRGPWDNVALLFMSSSKEELKMWQRRECFEGPADACLGQKREAHRNQQKACLLGEPLAWSHPRSGTSSLGSTGPFAEVSQESGEGVCLGRAGTFSSGKGVLPCKPEELTLIGNL